MSTPFQNRIVGTIIVAAVAIIFLPDIFDGEKERYQEAFEEIPVAPETTFSANNTKLSDDEFTALKTETLVDEVALDDPITKTDNNPKNTAKEPENSVEKAGSSEQAANSDSSSLKVNPISPAKAKADTAWVIQLGSFRHKKNVEQLAEKLRKAGYTVFTQPIKTKNGTLTKVFVGPELNKSSLEKKIPALKELTKVQGKVARYQPTK